jgi:VWFA-related protein
MPRQPRIKCNMMLDVFRDLLKRKQSRIWISCTIICVLFLSAALALFGQQRVGASGSSNRDIPESQIAYPSQAVILVHSDLVLIPVTVTDRNGKAVSGLEKEHFRIFEDAEEQQICHFLKEDVPASIGIVFDASDSMTSKMPKAVEAVNTLLRSAKPDDEFFFVRFSTAARVTVPMTTDAEEIRRAVESVRIGGTTALLDGVRVAMREMQHAHNQRKAIIIISDGEDNSSRWTVWELKNAVREQDIVIHSIGINDPPSAYAECRSGQACGMALLRDIATETGGHWFDVRRVKQLPDVAAKISSLLRNQYVLGYVPSRSEKDGTYRKIELKVEPPKGLSRLHAVWRQGYYAPKE